MKKSQAAMEFLMTYGWAILVVLVAIGALAYFRRPSSEPSEEEMERLHKMMERGYLKSKEEQDRVN